MHRVNYERSLPDALESYVVEALETYDMTAGGPGIKEIKEACTRVHTGFRVQIASFDEREGPLAFDGDLLVYSMTASEWDELCESIKVYGDAREWAKRIHEYAAQEISRTDPSIPAERVQAYYDSSESRAVVVEHP